MGVKTGIEKGCGLTNRFSRFVTYKKRYKTEHYTYERYYTNDR